MESKLDKMLDELNPIKDWIEKEKRGNEILRKYCTVLKDHTIKEFEEVSILLKEFMIPLWWNSQMNDEQRELFDKDLLDIALRHLKKYYPRNTLLSVTSIIISGAEGGVYQVLKNLVKQYVEENFIRYLDFKINNYLDELEDPEIMQLVKEYNENYSHLLSEKYRDNLESIFWNIDIILFEHFMQLKKLREIKN